MTQLNENNVNIITNMSGDELEDCTSMDLEDNIQQDNTNAESLGRKRTRDGRDENSSEDGWSTVTRRRNKVTCCRINQNETSTVEKIQVCVTCKDPLPKQFALARLFKTNNIPGDNIYRVKYVHQYKILITFNKESEADEFMKCKAFADLDWRCQKTSEVGISYGLIKSVELGISDEEFRTNVSSSGDIINFKRLNKRCSETTDGNGWTPSETIRVGFKGSSLPSYVYIYGLRVPVEPYIFPVTQCAKCWKYGHSSKMCPFKKIVCPKCTQNHENCTVSSFICVNCKGGHMAFEKICPVFRKEKKIRELMSDFNCTYRKALLIYVPPSPENNPRLFSEPTHVREQTSIRNALNIEASSSSRDINNCTEPRLELSDSTPMQPSHPKPLPKRNVQKNNRRPPTPVTESMWYVENESDYSENQHSINLDNKNKSNKFSHNITLWQLIKKISDIVKSEESLHIKVQQTVSILTEWLIQKILSSITIDALFEKLVKNG